jgi:phosphotransferase system enzyme I (PtsI)
MEGKPVTIRTIDVGADKKADYLHIPDEKNPAMGCRGIRYSLNKTNIFHTQLRALLRASVHGNLKIMLPMIISADEILKVKSLLKTVEGELFDKKIPYGKYQLGVMIETPAAVMISEILANMVDFFSIGTNDLTQYTLAIDRQNPLIEPYYNPHHPAILRMIELTVINAKSNGIPVGICGELASDTKLTDEFLRLGIDYLSVVPSKILPLKRSILGL